eukprot:TRINITY_DN3386_c0_g1_i1.p1 TRINITY_DN3386_c0_g1~~TRINITY_DN3386_c0_g1_i1.p1  ORF type:complete len:227 (-),score=64.36 TRINITY_DN3386_c0_g1_i1:395-1075(-)
MEPIAARLRPRPQPLQPPSSKRGRAAAPPHKKQTSAKSTSPSKANTRGYNTVAAPNMCGNEKKQKTVHPSQETILMLLEEQEHLPTLANDAKEALAEYLTFNPIGEEDPLLLVQFLPRIGVVNNNAGFQQNVDDVVNGLTANGAENVQNKDCVFKFNSWDDLYAARQALRRRALPGNIEWAFFLSPDTALTAGVPAGVPTANTAVITFFSLAQARLTSDRYDFFAL